MNDEVHIETNIGKRIDSEVIHGENGVGMHGDEFPPGGRFSDHASASEIAENVPDGCLVERNAELEEFAPNLAASHEDVLILYLQNKKAGSKRSDRPSDFFT